VLLYIITKDSLLSKERSKFSDTHTNFSESAL